MFDINEITPLFNGARFSCECLCDSADAAEDIIAHYRGPIFLKAQELKCHVELMPKGRRVILDTPDKEKTKELAIILNGWIEKMPNL